MLQSSCSGLRQCSDLQDVVEEDVGQGSGGSNVVGLMESARS